MTEQELPTLELPGVTATATEPHRLTLAIDIAIASVEQAVSAALARLTVRDLIIENPPLEDTIRAIYSNAAEADHAQTAV